MRLWQLLTIGMTTLLVSCASIPEPLQGEYPVTYPAHVNIAQVGSRVRWGGSIIATNPESHQTCIEILGKTLESSTRPISADESQGRFIACKSGFQDPELFKAGRDITIIGTVDRLEIRTIGEYEYRYPVINADTVYLWPERQEYRDRGYPYYPYYWYRPYPFWGPYPYYGSYYYPYRGYPGRSSVHGHVTVKKK